MQLDKRLFDREWRMHHFWTIRNKNADLIRFKPNKMQQLFEQERHTRNIILKSRQLGMTTYSLIDRIDQALFKRNTEALIIFQDQNVSRKKFRDVVMLAFNMVPAPMRDQLWKVVNDKAEQLTVDFGSGETSTIMTAISGRGSTPNTVHISEYAKICSDYPDKAEEIRRGLIPAVPASGRVDIESTAEGVAGDFHDTFWEAWNRGTPSHPLQFKAHFFNWQLDTDIIEATPYFEIPAEHQATFRDYQKQHKLTDKEINWYYLTWENVAGKDWARMKEQYPTTPEEAFEVAGDKYFDKQSVDRLTANTSKPEGHYGWKVYEKPMPNAVYAIGADVSEGIGRDASAASIIRFDKEKSKVVATYVNDSIEPGDYADVLEMMARKYNNALIAIERNNHGHAVIQRIKDNYWNLYKEQRTDKRTNERTERIGWLTRQKNKIDMLDTMRDTLINDELEVPSKDVQYEMRMFPKEYVAMRENDKKITKHFDLLIATCICYKMLDVVYLGKTRTSVSSTSADPTLGGLSNVAEQKVGRPLEKMDPTEAEWARQLERQERNTSDTMFDFL